MPRHSLVAPLARPLGRGAAFAAMADSVVTRQCGLSSVAAHRGLVTAFRNFVDQANRISAYSCVT